MKFQNLSRMQGTVQTAGRLAAVEIQIVLELGVVVRGPRRDIGERSRRAVDRGGRVPPVARPPGRPVQQFAADRCAQRHSAAVVYTRRAEVRGALRGRTFGQRPCERHGVRRPVRVPVLRDAQRLREDVALDRLRRRTASGSGRCGRRDARAAHAVPVFVEIVLHELCRTRGRHHERRRPMASQLVQGARAVRVSRRVRGRVRAVGNLRRRRRPDLDQGWPICRHFG